MSLVSLATLQSWTGVTDDDATLVAIEAGVTAFLQRVCNRDLSTPQASYQDIVRGADYLPGALTAPINPPDIPFVLLNHLPTGAVTAVDYRYSVQSEWASQDLADFESDADNPRILYVVSGLLPAGQRTVRVTYPRGYDEDGGPADVHLFICKMVNWLYQNRDSGNIKSESEGGTSVTYDSVRAAGLIDELSLITEPLSAV